MLQTTMTVVKQTEIARHVYELVLQGENVATMQPGQFLMVRPVRTELLLRRPISICSYDKAAGTCTLLYRVEGAGTKDFSKLQSNDSVDCLGPLGTGFDVSEAQTAGVKSALLIGGGIGVPPMYQLGKELAAQGIEVTFVNGFQSHTDIFYEKEMAAYGSVHIATVDGSYGTQGFVTDITRKLPEPDRVYSCGPRPMLQAVKSSYAGSKTYLSLEERMACGIGACYACVCPKKDTDSWLKVCEDGPVFRADEVEL
ncbi:oxidoreductase NAD-binding domain protein [Listeria grayi DSM 20601]|uniref:Dihydroorotate dehydrogenase B (NAD(+)), electron transfer subunit n=2 Tax=Listeria grayi TaxID=1641 RepID=D7UVF4_LISGR|nr:oxidoreductase NAD-binding domain protein [Listeria grayi DSM 20601]